MDRDKMIKTQNSFIELRESIFKMQTTFQMLCEVLADHEQRLNELEKRRCNCEG